MLEIYTVNLLQIFINIIDNSISIAEKNTKILLQVKSLDKSHVQIKIYDQGKGVSIDDHQRIFNRSWRLGGQRILGSPILRPIRNP